MGNHSVRGMLDVDTLKQLVQDEQIETVLTVFPDLYGRLMGKRIMGEYFVNDVLKYHIHACDYLLACDMEMDPVPGYAFTSWATGYGDFRLVPDLTTLRIASWLEKTAIVLCDVFNEEADIPVTVAPRNILKKQLDTAKSLGYSLMGASELELYVFDDSYAEAKRKNYHDLKPIGDYIEDYHIFQGTKEEFVVGAIRKHLDRSGIPVEFSKGEWGPGQQEINLRYTNFLEMCDRHILYKHLAKEIAWQNDKAITFMAKWDERYAGSSMHLHVSLWDAEGTPLFPGEEAFGPVHSSTLFRWFWEDGWPISGKSLRSTPPTQALINATLRVHLPLRVLPGPMTTARQASGFLVMVRPFVWSAAPRCRCQSLPCFCGNACSRIRWH